MMDAAGSFRNSGVEIFSRNHPRIFGAFLMIAALSLFALAAFLVSDILSLQSSPADEFVSHGTNQSEAEAAGIWDEALGTLSSARDRILIRAGPKTDTASGRDGDEGLQTAADEAGSKESMVTEKGASKSSENAGSAQNEGVDKSRINSTPAAKDESSSKSYVTVPVKSSRGSSSKSKSSGGGSSSSSSTSSDKSLPEKADSAQSAVALEAPRSSDSGAGKDQNGSLSLPADGINITASSSAADPAGSLTIDGIIPSISLDRVNDSIVIENSSSTVAVMAASGSQGASGDQVNLSQAFSLPEAGDSIIPDDREGEPAANNSVAWEIAGNSALNSSNGESQPSAEGGLDSSSDADNTISSEAPEQSGQLDSRTTASQSRTERNVVRPERPSRPQVSRPTRGNAASDQGNAVVSTPASGHEDTQTASGQITNDSSTPAQPPSENSIDSSSEADNALSGGAPEQSTQEESRTIASQSMTERNVVRPERPSRPQVSRTTSGNEALPETSDQPAEVTNGPAASEDGQADQQNPQRTIAARPERPAPPSRPAVRR
ncbi:MAG: hypothetical protein HPY61_08005 [Methanotrichaceae archaeon]|nr:hypothetical protein [Methanotrichaceae archaeon]